MKFTILLSVLTLGADDGLDRIRLRQTENQRQLDGLRNSKPLTWREQQAKGFQDTGIARTEHVTVLAPHGNYLAARICEAAEAMQPLRKVHISVRFEGEPSSVSLRCGPGERFNGADRIWLQGATEDNWRPLLEQAIRELSGEQDGPVAWSASFETCSTCWGPQSKEEG